MAPARVRYYQRAHEVSRASVEEVADGDTNSRAIWTVDVLPHEIARYIGGQIDQDVLAMQKALRCVVA